MGCGAGPAHCMHQKAYGGTLKGAGIICANKTYCSPQLFLWPCCNCHYTSSTDKAQQGLPFQNVALFTLRCVEQMPDSTSHEKKSLVFKNTYLFQGLVFQMIDIKLAAFLRPYSLESRSVFPSPICLTRKFFQTTLQRAAIHFSERFESCPD